MTRLLTVEEVAERLGVRKQWVWAQARAGKIPCVPLGRYRRFREEAVDAWIRGLEFEAEAANADRRDVRSR
jgi:excisionase family DNA binding protein